MFVFWDIVCVLVRRHFERAPCTRTSGLHLRSPRTHLNFMSCCSACVVSAIGAPEDKPFDTSAPRKIDGEAAIALVEEAKASGVKRFIMVTSLGTTKIGWPASVLNLFWGVLYFKKLAEQALIRSGMAYTIVRPGGMERPTDTYKETHNTVLYPRDTQFGGQVSRLQVLPAANCHCSISLGTPLAMPLLPFQKPQTL